jgi:hypothetical protein
MSRGGLSLFLGAGFSKWAAGLPVANDLFDFAVEPIGPREARRLEIAKSLKHEWDLAHPGGLAEQFIAAALGREQKQRQAVLWYVVRRLSEPFIWTEYHATRWRRHVLMIDENRKFAIPGIVKAQKFLQRVLALHFQGIVTTNYDMIVEYALGTKGFNYGVQGETLQGRGPYPVSQWRNPVTLEGRVSVAKIHGSISWDEHAFYTDGRRGLTGRALIVAPIPQKRPPASLKGTWKLAAHILQRAERLAFFGFSFNPYDEAVLKLLRSAGSDATSVLVIDKDPKLDRVAELFPGAAIISCQPPPTGIHAMRDWFLSLV